MDVGGCFDCYGSLLTPVLGLLVSLGIQFELGDELSEFTLVLDNHKDYLEVPKQSQILVDQVGYESLA